VELVAKGYVSLERRQRADGLRTSNRYTLKCVAGPDKLSRGVDTNFLGPRITVSRGPDKDVRQPTTYPLSNPTPRQRDVDAAPGGETEPEVPARGVRDWEFPEALSAGQIAALRDVLSDVEKERGQQVLDELAGRMRLGPIGNPIRYCAVLLERAQCGQFKSELGIRVAEARAARPQSVELEAIRARPDRASIEATLWRLPKELRVPLERMRSRPNDGTAAPQPVESDDDAQR